MEKVKGFNLFRVNCLLNDSKSSNFNSVILSIIYEYFYENSNSPKTVNEIYSYIKDYLKIVIDFDFLESLISKTEDFEFDPLNKTSTITIKPEKYLSIEQTITLNSVSKHIQNFLVNSDTDFKFESSIENLLYAAVFENINSFSVDNLKSIIPNVESEEFSKIEIDIFNTFLDYHDDDKNKAIFDILSRAVEFAILTSGKGIKEISQEIFNDKTFILDTNIIFRLLGVGGDERHESVLNLIEKCRLLGIKFEYTGKTHLELHHKLDQIINFLNTAKVLTNIDMVGAISETHPEMFNDDFIVHFAHLKRQGDVSTPEQYQRKLIRDYQVLCTKLEIRVCQDDNIPGGEVARFGKYLLSKKQEMRIYYGRKAAEVDAYNVLLVRKMRGPNNYNLSDVKSFYLTSDRSLNSILSIENTSNIPETILPSQLFILCKPYFDTDTIDDYGEFIKFIKRRKTGFKYGGSQVLNYINSIRELTTDVEVISESLIMYSNIRFTTAKDTIFETESNIPNYKTVLKTILDGQIEKGREAESVFEALKTEISSFVNKKFKLARNIVRVFDAIVIISIIPLVLFLSKLITENIVVQLALIGIAEYFKFLLSSRFNIFNSLHLNLYKRFTRVKRKEVLNIHADLVEIITTKGEETSNNIWA